MFCDFSSSNGDVTLVCCCAPDHSPWEHILFTAEEREMFREVITADPFIRAAEASK